MLEILETPTDVCKPLEKLLISQLFLEFKLVKNSFLSKIKCTDFFLEFHADEVQMLLKLYGSILSEDLLLLDLELLNAAFETLSVCVLFTFNCLSLGLDQGQQMRAGLVTDWQRGLKPLLFSIKFSFLVLYESLPKRLLLC